MRQLSAERIHYDGERRSHYYRKRRHRCGTERVLRRRGPPRRRAQKKGAPKGQKAPKGGKAKAAPKKEAKTGKKAKPAPAKDASTPRAESKGAKILSLIRRPKGASLAEIMKSHGLAETFDPVRIPAM
jgi:hypothetical protein